MSFLMKFLSVPVVKAQEEELVDPQANLRENCGSKSHIQNLFEKYQTCNKRVNSKSKTTEICTEEFFDYLHELDHCVAHSLWLHLK